MKISEKDRLDLRQELGRVFSNKRFAEIAMEAMPPIDYDQLATKNDVAVLGRELRGEMAQLHGGIKGDMAGLRAEMVDFRSEIRPDMADFRSEVRTDTARLRSELAILAADTKLDSANLSREVTRMTRLAIVSQLTALIAVVTLVMNTV